MPAASSTRYWKSETGCGYQTTILSKLAREVYSIERIAPCSTRRVSICAKCASSMSASNMATDTQKFPRLPCLKPLCHRRCNPRPASPAAAIGDWRTHEFCHSGINEQFLWLIERHADGFVETKLEPVRLSSCFGYRLTLRKTLNIVFTTNINKC